MPAESVIDKNKPKKKKKRRVDLSIALPAVFKKGQDAISGMRVDMEATVGKAQAALTASESWTEASMAFDGYKSTCATRLKVGQAFLANKLSACPSLPAGAPDAVAPEGAEGSGDQQAPPSEGASQLAHEGSAITCRVRQLLRLEGQAKCAVQDVESVRSLQEIDGEVQGVLRVLGADALAAHQKWLKEALDVCKQLRLAITKSADAVSGFIDQHAKALVRQQKRMEKDEENAAIAKAKARSKIAAEKVKEFKGEPLFNLDMLGRIRKNIVSEVKKYSADDTIKDLPVHTPWLISSANFHKEWRESNVIQVTLGNFGGQYKKQKSAKSEGRGQVPMNSKEGKLETDTFMARLEAHMTGRRADLGEAGNVLSHTWIFGYEPRNTQASMTPYGLGLFRALAEGEVHTLLVGSASCMTAWGALRGADRSAKVTYEELMKELLLFDEAALQQFVSKGAVVMYVYLAAWQTLYIPSGWFVMDRASDSALIYGCRKSTAFAHADSHKSYQALIKLYKQSGKPVQKMEAVLPKLLPSQAAQAQA